MKTLYLIIATSLLIACKGENNQVETKSETVETVAESSQPKQTPKTTNNGTLLCKINGQDWYYTKASGVVAKNDNIGHRRATITFKKKLDKGSESVQIEYNSETNEVTRVLIRLKRIGINGETISAFYTMRLGYVKAGEQMLGTVNLSDPNNASGTAKITIENDHEKAKLKPEDHLLHITELRYSGVGYSDINREFDKYKN